MKDIILRTNAIPVYGFLSNILSLSPAPQWQAAPKVLDCGAGGGLPPLALFARQGFEVYGIDTSAEQIERSRQYWTANNLPVEIRKADMRQIPFEADTFDYVYEHFSMCHLDQVGTAQTVSEMMRVLKPGGLAFIGVISTDSWPHSQFGKEQRPGVLVGAEAGRQHVTHSLWTDAEADRLVRGWEVFDKEKKISYLVDMAAQASLEDWMSLYAEALHGETIEEWRSAYPRRLDYYRYVHVYFYLRKPMTA